MQKGLILFRAGEELKQRIDNTCIDLDISQVAFMHNAVKEYLERADKGLIHGGEPTRKKRRGRVLVRKETAVDAIVEEWKKEQSDAQTYN